MMNDDVILQLNLEIINELSVECNTIINRVIQKFKDNPYLDFAFDLNFSLVYYDISSERLYAEEISECRNEEGEIVGLIATFYLFRKKLDTIPINDHFINQTNVVRNLNFIFDLKPQVFEEVFSTSNTLQFCSEDLKLLGRKKKPPIFN